MSSIGGYEESEITERQQQPLERKQSQEMSSEDLINPELLEELRQLEEQEEIKKTMYEEELNRQKEVLK